MAQSAPLDAVDPDRARVLRAKIRDRLTDLQRHLRALRAAMAEFGEDFDLVVFAEAHASDDPVALNRVKAVERGVDQLYNYIAELTAFGLELALLRRRDDDLNARRDLETLKRAGVVTGALAAQLDRVRELRRLLVHEYATATAAQVHEAATAAQVHEAARLVAGTFVPFYNDYREWIARGFDQGKAAAD